MRGDSTADYITQAGQQSMTTTNPAYSGLFKAGLQFGDIATAGAFSLAQGALGFFADQQAAETEYQNAKRNHKLMVQQGRQRTAEINEGIDLENRYALYQHNEIKKQALQQVAFNAEAANMAYISERNRINEIALQYGFQSEMMRGQLMESIGYNRALNEGNRGRSFERAAALATTGNYGRAKFQAAEGLRSKQQASRDKIKNIELQNRRADATAMAKASVMPFLKRHVNPINYGPGPKRTFNTGMQIANRLMGAGMSAAGMLM